VNEHEALAERAAASAHTVALIGGLDSGKTTLAKELLKTAISRGRSGAFVDADVGQKTVGPPTTIGLKLIRTEADLEPASLQRADSLAFVGSRPNEAPPGKARRRGRYSGEYR